MTRAQAAEASRLLLNMRAHLQVIGEVHAVPALLDAILACDLPPGALRHLSRTLDREADARERVTAPPL